MRKSFASAAAALDGVSFDGMTICAGGFGLIEHTSKNGDPKFTPACTLPLTGKNVVDMVITDLCVFQRPDHQSPFRLVELAPGVTMAEAREKTTATFASAGLDRSQAI